MAWYHEESGSCEVITKEEIPTVNGHEKFPTYVENISSINYRKVVQICLQSKEKLPVQRASHPYIDGKVLSKKGEAQWRKK